MFQWKILAIAAVYCPENPVGVPLTLVTSLKASYVTAGRSEIKGSLSINGLIFGDRVK